MALEPAQAWVDLFTRWPVSVARKGVLVTNFGEQILFSGFMASPTMLLIERQTPDTVGARKVLVPYANISGIKIVEIVKSAAFQELGFEGKIASG
ncbi:MAG: hypothetical protein WD875_06610 [Pirellulales bacterium]